MNALALDGIGNLYVADGAGNTVWQIVLVPSPLLSAVLPGSRSVQLGTPATAFATMVNTSDQDLSGCRLELPGPAPTALSLDYRPTDPSTNEVVGVLNQPVSIPAGGTQTFVLGLQSSAAVTAPNQPLVFRCDGVSPAPTAVGVNTLDLRFSQNSEPDIIALSATASGDGIVTVPLSQSQPGAFTAGSINVGSPGTIQVSVEVGPASLPVTAVVCESNPSTAQCQQPPAQSIQMNVPSNAQSTFSIFVSATAAVPLAPDTSRIVLRFRDADGVSHGSTSVAVTTR